MAIDEAIVERAAVEPCRFCGGPLHRGDYPRKPRGGLVAVAAEAFARRFSLCCGREGCRHRATPPSVRFLGRRVYVGAVVIVASVVALAHEERRARRHGRRGCRRGRRAAGCAGGAARSRPAAPFVELSARLVPALERRSLPTSMLERLGADAATRVQRLLGWLAPITTTATVDGSRLLRASCSHSRHRRPTQKMAQPGFFRVP